MALGLTRTLLICEAAGGDTGEMIVLFYREKSELSD